MEKKLMNMNSKIRNRYFILCFLLFICSFFTGCINPDKIEKDSIVLLTENQIMDKVRNAYEGKFTCKKYKADEVTKTVHADVFCELDGKSFEFEVIEDHKVDNYFYSYYSKEKGLLTSYYAKRYENKLKEEVIKILKEEFKEVEDKITFVYNGVFVKNAITDKFNSAEEYIDSLKSDEYMRVSCDLKVPFAEKGNKEFELLLKAYEVVWISVYPVYNYTE